MSEEIPSSESAEENKVQNDQESEDKTQGLKATKFKSNFANGKFEKMGKGIRHKERSNKYCTSSASE